jgi:hypothetical protein
MPVLPEVGSIMMESGRICPAAFDHGQADAVLDAVGGAIEFEFGEDLAGGAGGQPVDANQRRIADQFSDVVGYVHAGTPRVAGVPSLRRFI